CRAAAAVQDDGARIWSRRATDLTSTFPEIVAALEAQLDPGVVLDSELVVWQDGRLAFEVLQHSHHHRPGSPGTGLARTSGSRPSRYCARSWAHSRAHAFFCSP